MRRIKEMMMSPTILHLMFHCMRDIKMALVCLAEKREYALAILINNLT